MKKMIKLSLVAAVAVAGLSTSAVAGSLEEAIKDTTISGKFMVGYNNTVTKEANNAETTADEWEYDVDLTLNTKVNDVITAQFGVEADHEIQTRETSTDKNKGGEIGITKLNFIAKTDVATVIVGKQKQPTPFLDDERADGVVALVPAGPVTLAAGHFTGMNGGADADKNQVMNVNLSERDISAVALLGAAGPVNFSAWYLAASGADSDLGLTPASADSHVVEKGVDGYSVNVKVKAGPANVELAHASLQLDAKSNSNFDAETLTKVIASVEAGPATVFGAYAMTNDASHNTPLGASSHTRLHGVDLSDDDDSATNFALELTKLDKFNDASAYLVGATATMDKISVTGQYLMATVASHKAGESDTDATELNLDVAYAMSKNFNISALYATQEIDAHGTADDSDTDSIQLSMNYKF